jgi:hypothetical protein
MTEPLETAHMPAIARAAVEDEIVLMTALTAVAVQNSEGAAAKVPWPPEGATRGEVQTWAVRAGSSSAV